MGFCTLEKMHLEHLAPVCLDIPSDCLSLNPGVFFLQEMLKEKGVAPFSKWEKELPKIIFDPRFKVGAMFYSDTFLLIFYVAVIFA